MPWCGYWGIACSAFWWVLPLIGLVFMGIMFLVCFRRLGCGCMGERRRSRGELSGAQRLNRTNSLTGGNSPKDR